MVETEIAHRAAQVCDISAPSALDVITDLEFIKPRFHVSISSCIHCDETEKVGEATAECRNCPPSFGIRTIALTPRTR